MGLTANVVAGAPVLSTWGNEIRDRTVQPFASAAERSAQWPTPPEGATSYLRDLDVFQVYDGTVWRTPGKPYAQTIRIAGDLSLNSAAWATVNTSLDLVVAATAGDIIEVCPNFMCGSEALDFAFDFIFVTSSLNLSQHAAENAAGYGAPGWRADPGVFSAISGALYCACSAGDLTGGQATLRLRYRQPGGAGAKTVKGTATQPLILSARNHGPDAG